MTYDYIFVRVKHYEDHIEMPVSVVELRDDPALILAVINELHAIMEDIINPVYHYTTRGDAERDTNRIHKFIPKAHAEGFTYVINPMWLRAKFGTERVVQERTIPHASMAS